MTRRKNFWFTTVMVLAFVLIIISPNLVAESSNTNLILGSSSPGGTYFIWAGGWADIMQKNVKGVNISVQEGGGSSTNIQLIQQGKMDLGLSQVDMAYQGRNGLGWAKGLKYDKFRSIIPMYSSCLHIYTLEKTPITSIYDLEGKHIATGPAGSGSETVGRQILELLEITPSKISMLSPSSAIESLKDNIIDAAFILTGLPAPAMLELETTHKIRFIGMSDVDLEKIIKKYPYFVAGAISKGTYKNMKEDVKVVSFWEMAIASESLSDDLVYDLVKATFDNKEALVRVVNVAKAMFPEKITSCVVPLHPGALKYYQEVGVEIPDSMLPPIQN